MVRINVLKHFKLRSFGCFHPEDGGGQHGPLKRWYPTTSHGITTQKTLA